MSRLALAGQAKNRALFGIEQTWDGTARAVTLASEADKVVIVLGTNPVINGQIGQDREQYGLPSAQIALFEAVKKVNEQVIVVVVSNYPHDLMPLQEQKPFSLRRLVVRNWEELLQMLCLAHIIRQED